MRLRFLMQIGALIDLHGSFRPCPCCKGSAPYIIYLYIHYIFHRKYGKKHSVLASDRETEKQTLLSRIELHTFTGSCRATERDRYRLAGWLYSKLYFTSSSFLSSSLILRTDSLANMLMRERRGEENGDDDANERRRSLWSEKAALDWLQSLVAPASAGGWWCVCFCL